MFNTENNVRKNSLLFTVHNGHFSPILLNKDISKYKLKMKSLHVKDWFFSSVNLNVKTPTEMMFAV